ncbi:UDP-glycosyltransferase 79A2-like [Nymphaea colorata]|uniref:Glycosyltransferase n=1 Tax=Nymphaea colorata TaxID=210225 RepID=A0A5K1DG09_9MAGN|nr:UDP-glycosyltransferase 79A2-like [Nymphaea colorata]
MNGDSHPLRLVMLPWLGFGHICPFIQLSNALIDHGIEVTFLSPPTLVAKIRATLHPSIPIVNYNLTPVPGLPAGVESTVAAQSANLLLMEALDASKPQIEGLLRKLNPTIIVFDFVYYWLPQLADSLGIKSVFFYIGTALSATPMKIFTKLHPKKLALSVVEMLPVKVVSAFTGLKLYETRDLLQFVYKHQRSSISPCSRMLAVMMMSSSVLLKSATELEDPYINFVTSLCGKKALLCGTLTSKPPTGELEGRWEKWLSQFPSRSVVFCSFGSEFCLSIEQIAELVAGLEMSGCPFLAVLNFSAQAKEHGLEAKVVGERMGGKGVVHSGWVQQQHILRHPSVGAHIGHGGLSSMMEAIIGGCQTVLLPQTMDQFLNAKLVVKRLKAGVSVKRRSRDGWFTREALCEAVKMAMKDETEKAKAMRANNTKLREFLLNEKVQQQYVQGFVAKLKEMASASTPSPSMSLTI